MSHGFKLTVANPSGGTFLADVDLFPKPHDSSAVLELVAVFGVQKPPGASRDLSGQVHQLAFDSSTRVAGGVGLR